MPSALQKVLGRAVHHYIYIYQNVLGEILAAAVILIIVIVILCLLDSLERRRGLWAYRHRK